MMEHVPASRRGRPATKAAKPAPAKRERAPVTERAAEPVASETKVPGRRRRASVGGHSLKLAAPSRPGFIRRWFNDLDNRIADAGELAYDHVQDPSVKSTDAGSRISRLVGTKANGEPLRAYLMETPDAEFQAGLDEKEARNAEIDEAIRQGVPTADGQQIGPQSETYGQGSIKRA